MALTVDRVLVCEGKHCRRAQEDAARARRSLEGAAREGGARLVLVDCLSACDDAPVATLVDTRVDARVDGPRLTFIGRLTKEKHTLALCDVVAGRTAALGDRLERRVLEASGKMNKRAMRALDV